MKFLAYKTNTNDYFHLHFFFFLLQKIAYDFILAIAHPIHTTYHTYIQYTRIPRNTPTNSLTCESIKYYALQPAYRTLSTHGCPLVTSQRHISYCRATSITPIISGRIRSHVPCLICTVCPAWSDT